MHTHTHTHMYRHAWRASEWFYWFLLTAGRVLARQPYNTELSSAAAAGAREIEADNAVVASLLFLLLLLLSFHLLFFARCRLSCRDLIIWPLFLFATSDNLNGIFILLIYICLLFLFPFRSGKCSLFSLLCFLFPLFILLSLCFALHAMHPFSIAAMTWIHFKWFINRAKDKLPSYKLPQAKVKEVSKMNMLNIIKNAYP